MAQTHIPRETEKLLDEEREAAESRDGVERSRADMVRDLIIEVRRLREIEARVLSAGSASPEAQRRPLGPPRYKPGRLDL